MFREFKRGDIEEAIKNTKSAAAAARYLSVHHKTFKKYASQYIDEETGKSLYELSTNKSGKGILKVKGKEPNHFLEILAGRLDSSYYSPQFIKQRILDKALIAPECRRCGYNEKRIQDNKVPLVLNHINQDNSDFALGNLEFLCYNCSFQYAIEPITETQISAQEDYVEGRKEFDWEVDESYMKHLEDLGLSTSAEDISEFISKDNPDVENKFE